MKKNKLNSCPFCGCKDINIREGKHPYIEGKGYYVWCDMCGVRTDIYDTEKKAITKWNRRSDNEQRETDNS